MPGNPSAHRRFEGLRTAHESAGNHLRCSCPDGGRLFVLTGSSNIFSTGHVADSLAGRMLTLTLWPLTVAETMSRGPSMVLDWAVSKEPDLTELPPAEPATRADYIDRVLKGAFPRSATLITAGGKGSMVVRLGAWTSGEARREIKNAKHHFVDAGVAAALRSLAPRSFDLDADPTALGGLLESFVFFELLRCAPYQVFVSTTGAISGDARSIFWQRAPTAWPPSKSRPPHR